MNRAGFILRAAASDGLSANGDASPSETPEPPLALTASQGSDNPASVSCSVSGMSRKLSIPKAARKISVVTKV